MCSLGIGEMVRFSSARLCFIAFERGFSPTHTCSPQKKCIYTDTSLGGGFKDFFFSPLFGEMIQFDEHIFQRGWFNHQVVHLVDNSQFCFSEIFQNEEKSMRGPREFQWDCRKSKGHRAYIYIYIYLSINV